jgi:co-chaperonin GroES (HSP10)
MENKSGIHPLGHRLLIEPQDVEEVSKGGIIIAIGSGKDREQMSQIMGVVVEVGETCWKDQAVGDWVRPGDMIMFGKYAGLIAQGKDEKQYRIINDLDVIALLEEPEEILIERVQL